MTELPEAQRPYEKCMENGPFVLSDTELLAVILRSGTKERNSLELAESILREMDQTAYPGLPGLIHLSIHDLQRIKGIGKVKAIQLKCIGELSKRIAAASVRDQISYDRPDIIAQYYMERLRHEETEHLYCMMLDTKNHLIHESLLSRGTVNATLITPREVFIEATRYHAVNIILIHNHPSGDPSYSSGDREITDKILESGRIMGINLLDHIIIGDHKYFSFKEQGLF